MDVKKVIIHELFKPAGNSGAKLRKSNSLMDHTHEDVQKLIIELNTRYRRRDEKMGVFDKENPTIFHDSFSVFFDHPEDIDKFIHFSHASAENLKDRIEGIGSAKGGYLIYAQYDEYRPYCSVFFVRDTTSMAFKRNNTVANFDIAKVQHIDFEKLAMACRINMQLFNAENSKYLSFIHHKNDTISKYFINWISSSDTVTSEQETNTLLRALRTIPMPLMGDTNFPYERDFVIQSAHKYITSSLTRSTNLRDLSKVIFGDEDYLPDYVYEHYENLPNEFKAHASALRKFVKVYAKTNAIELNFYPSALNDGTIRLDQNDEDQLIIHSKDLLTQIRAALGIQ